MLQQLVIEVFDNKRGRNLLEALQESLWIETPRDRNNTNEYIFLAGKKALVRDLEIFLNNKEDLK